MKTHLVKWDEAYRKQGLVIINIDNGQIDSYDRLRSEIAAAGIPYAVAWDEGARTCAEYGVRGYAASFLIGTDGAVAWEGFPLGRPIAEREERIRRELANVSEAERVKIGAE